MDFPVPSPDRTHHLYNGAPIYQERYIEVREYAFPGLAAARDACGWFHIDFSGAPVYNERYLFAGDFSDDAARVKAVVKSETKSEDGRPETVFFYIDAAGERIGFMEYVWAGDFHEGVACVYHKRFGAAHITTAGELLYNAWFYDVRPFEGDRARVRDESGWKFIDRAGDVLGCADEPADTYPRGTVRKVPAKNTIPDIIRSHSGYDASVILIRHAEREPFRKGEGGLDKKLTRRGEEAARAFGASLPKIAKAYASSARRCMQTAELIAGSAEADSLLGMPGAYIYDDASSFEYYSTHDVVSIIRSYLHGADLPGHYPVKEGTDRFLAHLKSVAEEGKTVLCVTHDAFAVSSAGVLTGHSFDDDWIDFLDGYVLFRYGTVWKLVWREGEFFV